MNEFWGKYTTVRTNERLQKRIDSRTFYKHHHSSHYCWATVENGKIISLYSEYGREGGEIWSPKSEWNGTLEHCLTRLSEDFGIKFYEAVYKAACKDKLLPPKAIKSNIRQEAVKRAKDKVARTSKEYQEAIMELDSVLQGE